MKLVQLQCIKSSIAALKKLRGYAPCNRGPTVCTSSALAALRALHMKESTATTASRPFGPQICIGQTGCSSQGMQIQELPNPEAQQERAGHMVGQRGKPLARMAGWPAGLLGSAQHQAVALLAPWSMTSFLGAKDHQTNN